MPNVNAAPSELILASASPRRATLLREAGFTFQVVSSRAEEIHPEHLTPHEICQVNSYRKARAVAKKIPDALVMGADTLVFLDNEVLGKPRNLAEAQQMIGRLQGRTHQVVTGVSLIQLRAHRERIFADSTDVLFHPLEARQIRDYLSTINPLDKAGAYAIQEHGEWLVSEISGSYSNVVGLPMERLREELATWNLVK